MRRMLSGKAIVRLLSSDQNPSGRQDMFGVHHIGITAAEDRAVCLIAQNDG